MEYLTKCADIYFGLSRKELKELAYQFAVKLGIDYPVGWIQNAAAGKDWFTGFMKRHPRLAMRKPEATSLARAAAFNEGNVKSFFTLLTEILARTRVNANSIWNMDETAITTVQKSYTLIARRGAKQVGKLTSAERGKLVTAAIAVSAAGNSIPPFFVFPRRRMKPDLLDGAPAGSIGVANPSGWMHQSNFLTFMEHFLKYVKCSINDPVLLLLDNHNSHLSVEALDLARNNGIHILSFPPHCSHALQPLDVSVYGPLKRYYNTELNRWMGNHGGRPFKVENIPAMLSIVLPKAVTPTTIQSGFRGTGIVPLNPQIFPPEMFLPSYISAQGAVQNDESENEEETRNIDILAPNDVPDPAAFVEVEAPGPRALRRTLEEVRPFPKPTPQRKSTRGRPPGRSTILTDDATRNELAAKQTKRNNAAAKKLENTRNRLQKKLRLEEAGKKKPKGKAPRKRPSTPSSSSEDEEDVDFCIICMQNMPTKLTKENSIACMQCKRDVHLRCANMERSYYVCPNCDSD